MFDMNDKHHIHFPGCNPFDRPGVFPSEKPRYTMTEEVEHTAREMRNTIERLLRFEKELEEKVSSLMSHLTSDNVAFKNVFAEAYNTFIIEVKNEVNNFESNTDATFTLFQKALESDYATLSEDCKKQIADSLTSYVAKLNEHKESLNTLYDEFRGSIEARIKANNDTQIASFNDYVTSMNTRIANAEKNLNQAYAEFTASVNTIVQSFVNEWSRGIEERLDGQDSTIADAVVYMKSNLNATLANIFQEMMENEQLVGVIDSTVVANVKQYGAKGDGVTDDSSAIQACIDENNNIYIPEGEYLIGCGLEILEHKRITGEGNKTVLLVNAGGDHAIRVHTDYTNRAEIRSLKIMAVEESCDDGGIACYREDDNGDVAWGGSVLVENVSIDVYPESDAIGLYSNFGSSIKNCRINGSISLYGEGENPETSFCNMNIFENVYINGGGIENCESCVRLINARNTQFIGCSIENALFAVYTEGKTQKTYLNGCWIEGCNYVYDVNDTSETPYMNHCNAVGVLSYSTSVPFAENIDVDYGKLVRIKEGSDSTALQSALRNEHYVTGCSLFDVENNLWSNLWNFSTHKGTYNAPFNTKVVNKVNSNMAQMIYKKAIAEYSPVPLKHDFFIMVQFGDGSKAFYKGWCIQVDYNTFIGFDFEKVQSQTWENSNEKNVSVTVEQENGSLSVIASDQVARILIVDNYTVLGPALNVNFEV